MSDDHTEPSGTLPAIGPAPPSFLNHNEGQKWAGGLRQDVARDRRAAPICAISRAGPSRSSFCVWARRSRVVRRSSRDFASSRVRASTLSNKRAFWIATTDWAAKEPMAAKRSEGRVGRRQPLAQRRPSIEQRVIPSSEQQRLCWSPLRPSRSRTRDGRTTLVPASSAPWFSKRRFGSTVPVSLR